jgi:hypothetical protein
MNENTPGGNDRMAAQIALDHQHVPVALARRIWELADNGLDLFEIQSILGVPLALIRMVLRGGSPAAKP